jgi:hypothetical protein
MRFPGTAKLKSFSYIDVIQGKSMVKFFGGNEASNYVLNTQTFWSDTELTAAATTDTAVVITATLDATLKRPRIIEGVCTINIPIYIKETNTNPASADATLTIQKVSGGTVVDLVSGNTTSITTNNDEVLSMKCIELDIPRTDFKVDDTFRIEVKVQGESNIPAGYTVGFAHDPKNRAAFTGDTEPTVFQAIIPFVTEAS